MFLRPIVHFNPFIELFIHRFIYSSILTQAYVFTHPYIDSSIHLPAPLYSLFFVFGIINIIILIVAFWVLSSLYIVCFNLNRHYSFLSLSLSLTILCAFVSVCLRVCGWSWIISVWIVWLILWSIA